MKKDKSFRPDRVLSYFRVEWFPLLLVTLSGLVYNIGLLAAPWFEGRLAQCLADILGGSETAAQMALLVLAYIAVHGFTLAGVPSYNHAVGNIFNPVVSLIFSMKTLLFAIAVALLPVANALRDIPRRASRTSVELQGLVQMFVLMLVIEIASLIGNYY